MRAGRLVELLLLLEHRGRMSATDLSAELEVSVRTIMRDVESLSGAGVPVRAIRGRNGGFELMEHFHATLVGPDQWSPKKRGPGPTRRAKVRISPDGRRLAAVLGRLQPIRVRRAIPPDERGWVEASFRLWSIEGAASDILSLGPEVEVLAPPVLRERVATQATAIAAHYDT